MMGWPTNLRRTIEYRSPELQNAWLRYSGILAAALITIILVYRDTLLSIIDIWERSETFAHSYVIAPISLWLIYRHRDALTVINPAVDYKGLIALTFVGFIWFLGKLADILLVEQYAFMMMIPCAVWVFMGWRVVKALAFPLGFLMLAVPNGDFLVQPLMNFTADFTVRLLQITGIPVFREGTFFSIPSGDWSVVEGCSGLRYLIASITLGCLFAYLSYQSIFKRLIFIGLSIITPIIANGLRAYMIVMIAHLSGMKLALGVDHLIYGWVFFGLVMLLLFWIGSFFSDSSQNKLSSLNNAHKNHNVSPAVFPALIRTYFLVLTVSLIWPARVVSIERQANSNLGHVDFSLPESFATWHEQAPWTDWSPNYQNPDEEFEKWYSDGIHNVALYVIYYRTERQGAELINQNNILVRQKHIVWNMPSEKPHETKLPGGPSKVLEGKLTSPEQSLLIWRWNRIDHTHMISNTLGKILETRDKLMGRRQDSVAIVVATDGDDDTASAEKVLLNFTSALLPLLDDRLNRAAGDQEL